MSRQKLPLVFPVYNNEYNDLKQLESNLQHWHHIRFRLISESNEYTVICFRKYKQMHGEQCYCHKMSKLFLYQNIATLLTLIRIDELTAP